MNAALGRKWIAALRSGEYKQGHGQLRRRLHSGDCHCVMGVLCELSPLFAYWGEYSTPVLHGDRDYGQRSCAFLPCEISEADGLTREQCLQLTRMNDKDGKTFLELADYIEQNLLDSE